MASSFLSKITLGRFVPVVGSLERDLARAVTQNLESSARLTDCFLPPAVYGFEKQACRSGIGQSTSVLEKRIAMAISPEATFEKVHYKVPVGGLFR